MTPPIMMYDVDGGAAASPSRALNLYATPAAWQRRDAALANVDGTLLLEMLEEASRQVDMLCRRGFFVKTETRYFDGPPNACGLLLVDDLLVVTAMACDSDADGDFDETWTESTDFVLEPSGFWPKRWIRRTVTTDQYWPAGNGVIQIAGIWGYGDGENQAPWAAAGITATLAAADTATFTFTVSGAVVAGQTILVEDEQMYVSAVSGTTTYTATVTRGVNGTTAAAHAAKPVYLAAYPARVRAATLAFAQEAWNQRRLHGFESERAGDWNYKMPAEGTAMQRWRRLLAGLIRA